MVTIRVPGDYSYVKNAMHDKKRCHETVVLWLTIPQRALLRSFSLLKIPTAHALARRVRCLSGQIYLPGWLWKAGFQFLVE